MDGVFAAITGEGHASDGVCGCGCGCGGRACWIAGEACADTCWLIGGDVDVPAAAADVDGVGTDAPSSSGPLSLLRFCARVDVAFSPSAVALIRIWCLAAVYEQNPCYTGAPAYLVRVGPHSRTTLSQSMFPAAFLLPSASSFSRSCSSSVHAPWLPALLIIPGGCPCNAGWGVVIIVGAADDMGT